jgi:hypothetical protein
MTGDHLPAAAGGSGQRLERAYRRLLRWYPAGHRARHADEMLGVLLASAGPGRRRPGRAESANLIGGALRIRLRAATTGSAGLWRDALSRAGRLLPLAWLVLVLTFSAPSLRQTGAAGFLNPSILAADAQLYLPTIVVLGTVLLGWRWLALAAIAATAVLNADELGLRHLPALQPDNAAYLAVLGITALALIVAPGRPRARLTGPLYLLTAVAAVAAGRAYQRLADLYPGRPSHHPALAGWPVPELAGLGVVAAITVVLLAWSPASRRLLIIVAVPLYFYAALLVTPPARAPSPLIFLPLAAPAAAVLLAVSRARRRRLPLTRR